MATFVKRWEGSRVSIGGLFGSKLQKHEDVLPWSRAQQAAVLIHIGSCMRDSVSKTKEPWAKELRKNQSRRLIDDSKEDPAFYGPYTLLTTDQGIRGLLHVTNDISYVRAKELKLREWGSDVEAGASDEQAVHAALASLKKQAFAEFLQEITSRLSKYDWRTSSAAELSEAERLGKAALRGSGGYKELRQSLLRQLAIDGKSIGKAANEVISALGYSK